MNLEKVLIEHIGRVGYEDIPEDALANCRLLIMDSLGVTIPGSHAPGCREVVELTRAWGGGGASVLIYGHRMTPPLAALANSSMMHALDFDDTLDVSALHTFVSVLPAALAAAEAVGGVDGKRFLSALVLGVDVICRLSLGIRRPLSWIRTATCGSFGAAAAAGKILGLDEGQIADALGVVYSQTSGNAQGLIEGRLVKRMQPGFAAQAGVLSAFLARAGITGSREFLQGRYGFYNLYEGGEFDPEPVVRDLGEHYTILDLSIKPYPSCRMTHASIDAALQLRGEIGDDFAGIDRVEVSASKMVTEMVGKPLVIGTNPQVDAQFSIPYTVAAALLRGDVFLNDFNVAAIDDPKVRKLARRVEVREDGALQAKDLLHAGMRIVMESGEVLETRVDAPLGNPGNPMSTDRCREKFRKCIACSDVVREESQWDELLDMIEHLDEVDNVCRLIALMRPGRE